MMEGIKENSGSVTYHAEMSADICAEKLNTFANVIQRPFWYCAQNAHYYYSNPLNDPALTDQIATRVLRCVPNAVGAACALFLAFPGFGLKGLSNYFHSPSREYTYWEGKGEEIRPEHPKVTHLNVCMFPGWLPYWFGGVRTAGERMEELKAFMEKIDPDIFFLCEFSQTLSGQLYDLFSDSYKHFFVSVGSNAMGMDASIAVVSRLPIVSAPQFFPSKTEPEGDQKYSYRGYFFVETDKVNYLYTHLHPTETDRAKEIRQEQLEEIKALIEENKNGKAWVVLGDINIERGSEGHESMQAKGFQDVIQDQHGNIETCINGLEEGITKDPKSFDAFLVFGDLILETSVQDTYQEPRKALSDHKAITAIIG